MNVATLAPRALTACGLAVLSTVPSLTPAATAGSPGEIRWEPYAYETRDGDVVSGCELGRLTVPERHERPDGPTIELAFVRFRCTGENPGPPIVWLAGGPGDHGSDDIEGPYLALVRELQKGGDVIALDQRGTGLSRPLLVCPDSTVTLASDRPLDREVALAAYLDLSRACARHFTDEGVDLGAYNTVESAHDVDFLRRALGAPRIHLYGGSYGTHLALAVLRHHEPGVDRVVLSGVEGPDHTWKLPSRIDEHFARVFAAARADEGVRAHFPDPESTLKELLERLATEPVTAEYEDGDGNARTIVLDDGDLRRALAAFLGSRGNIEHLPSILAQLAAGDYSLLARHAAQHRRIRVWSAMNRCMDCASGASPERLRRLEEEEPGSLAGRVDWPAPEICRAWPHAELDPSFRAPVRSSRPTLFLSGTLDGHTPPANAEEVMRGFSHATRILVEGGSHQYLELELPELTETLGRFLRGEPVGDTTLTIPLSFVLPEEES